MFTTFTCGTARGDSKAGLHDKSFVFTVSLDMYRRDASIAFKPHKKEQKKGDRASPWIQKVSILTAAFPKSLHHFQRQRRLHFPVLDPYSFDCLPRFLVRSSNPLALCERKPQKHTRRVQRGQSCAWLLRNWARTGTKPVNLRVRSLVHDQHLTEETNERTNAVHCRHFIWPHWPITRLVPGATWDACLRNSKGLPGLAWGSSSRQKHSCHVRPRQPRLISLWGTPRKFSQIYVTKA